MAKHFNISITLDEDPEAQEPWAGTYSLREVLPEIGDEEIISDSNCPQDFSKYPEDLLTHLFDHFNEAICNRIQPDEEDDDEN